MTDELPPDSPVPEVPARPVLKYKRKPRKKKARRKKLVRFDVATSIRILKSELKMLKAYSIKHDVSVSQLLRRIISGWLKYQKLDLGKYEIPTIGDSE